MPPPAALQQQEQQAAASLLLSLPEPLLLAAMQFLAAAGDQRSMFSAARAHSRLHQAVVTALGSIAVGGIKRRKRLKSVLLYLSKHGQHISSVSLAGVQDASLTLSQLPPTLQLHSLALNNLYVQLLPGDGRQGVLGYGGLSALKQLRLDRCKLLDGNKGLAKALALLPPGLQHLAFAFVSHADGTGNVAFPTSVLQQGLQQLTHLELDFANLRGADAASPALQPLQALSRLADLRLARLETVSSLTWEAPVLAASMLSGASGLTRLQLEGVELEPGALAGKTQLQHLSLVHCAVPGDVAWPQQLLAQLGSLQQLTHLSCPSLPQAALPAAAYSALTASSKLQHLHISNCTLPAGVWQHLFPAGRQLPHLTSLEASCVWQSPGQLITGPEGSRLVSCCPRLRRLDVGGMVYVTGAFGPLSALHGLRMLNVSLPNTSEASREVFQLTRLRELVVCASTDGLLPLMTQLRQLSKLTYSGPHTCRVVNYAKQAPGDEPVWRQVLGAHLNHSDPALAQQVAAALRVAE